MIEKLLGARYKVIKVLGVGGFSQTHVAQDIQRPGRPRCVVKQFKAADQKPAFLPVARRLFYNEAEILEKLGRHDQIPQLLAYFEEDEEFYLVQELIEGHPLHEELTPGKIQSEEWVINLLKDVLEVLEFVHVQGVIHRDIKPSNLIRRDSDGKLVLIDFGAVKQIRDQIADESKDEIDLTVGIGTKGYMPNEQLAGRPRFNSDIYAVGAIAIQALTGRRPYQLSNDPHTGEIVWRDRAEVSTRLGEIVDKMVCCDWRDRYQSATEVLEALKPLQKNSDPTSITRLSHTQMFFPRLPSRKVLAGVGAVLVGAVAIFAIAKVVFAPSDGSQSSLFSIADPDEKAAADRISFGSKIFAPSLENPAKQEGADLFAAGSYQQAISAWEAARKVDRRDPEILIDLNNARIGNAKAYAIAAPVPLDSTPNSALEILRGVAQAQDEINKAGGINGVPLKVAIADDQNQPKAAKGIAKALVKNSDILGVVGHGISDTTLAAGAIYQSGELVAISPLSSAVQLSGFSRYVFRTMPSDHFTAKSLSDYLLTKLQKPKVAIFFSSNSRYSQSLSNEFKNAIFYRSNGKIVAEFDLYKPDFNAYEAIEKAIKKGAEVIVLAANSDLSDRSLQVIQMNRKRLKILAGDGLYTNKILQIGGENAAGMVLAVPAAIVGDRESKFNKAAIQLWGEAVTWRTALSYDATKALIAGIQTRPSRIGVQRSLSASDFAVSGATGKVSFLPSGDREAAVQLVTVVSSKNGYEFKPLD